MFRVFSWNILRSCIGYDKSFMPQVTGHKMQITWQQFMNSSTLFKQGETLFPVPKLPLNEYRCNAFRADKGDVCACATESPKRVLPVGFKGNENFNFMFAQHDWAALHSLWVRAKKTVRKKMNGQAGMHRIKWGKRSCHSKQMDAVPARAHFMRQAYGGSF